MNGSGNSKRPTIVVTRKTPYVVHDLPRLETGRGREFVIKPVFSLCRCGKSEQKPFCDGAHINDGIKGERERNSSTDRFKAYHGKSITVYYNFAVCSHDGSCTFHLPEVFDREKTPWIFPDGAEPEKIMDVIHKCPSGALRYQYKDRLWVDMKERKTAIKIARNGPLEIVGYVYLDDDQETVTPSKEHYCLCRCGGSLMQPLCDGTHLKNEFTDNPEMSRYLQKKEEK